MHLCNMPSIQRCWLGRGYPSVLYIGANAERVTPRPEDFQTRRAASAPQLLIDAANNILETTKFNDLKIVNVTTGAGNPAFVLEVTDVIPKLPSRRLARKFISERNLSLGELCVLKLVRDITSCANNSLVLIDELELALHPRAQIRLLEFLEKKATDKTLTIVFSTHSASLLKKVKRESILFLESNNGVISTIQGCFATYALGNISFDEARAPDAVVYVEDESALAIVEVLVKLFISSKFGANPSLFPTVHVIPIGAFINVVRFLARSSALFPITTKSSALLDLDVKAENVQQWQDDKNYVALAEFAALAGKIQFLPWTPEVALVEYLSNPVANAQQKMRQDLGNNLLQLNQQDLLTDPQHVGGTKRKACKAAIRKISTQLNAASPNHSIDGIKKILFCQFAKWYFDQKKPQIAALLGPLI